MPTKRISKVVSINKIGVPVDEHNRYLNWNKIRGQYAEVLSSPFGHRHFVLGDEKGRIVLDFATLPDGQVVLEASPEPPDLGVHVEDQYNVHPAHETPEAAYHLVQHCIEVLDRNGIDYDDPWDFFRKLCTYVGVEP
jgi:hypothetical protein